MHKITNTPRVPCAFTYAAVALKQLSHSWVQTWVELLMSWQVPLINQPSDLSVQLFIIF